MTNSKKLLFITIIFLIAIVTAFLSYAYFNSLQKVTINPPSGSKVTLYKGIEGGEEGVTYDESSIVFSSSQKTIQKIKKGYYVYVLSPPNSDYRSKIIPLDIDDKTTDISPSLELTDTKLNAIAQSERANAQKVLVDKYPSTMHLYTIDKIAAYETGDWIAVSLRPSSPNLDTMVAIFKKQNGQLSLLTTPSIVLASPVYPEIPKNIIGAANRLVQDF